MGEEPKRIEVRIVMVQGESALVEAEGDRRYLPASLIKDLTVSKTAWSKAIPYGVDWDLLREGLSRAMRERGLWTYADVSRDQRTAWGIGRRFGIGLADINGFAARGG